MNPKHLRYGKVALDVFCLIVVIVGAITIYKVDAAPFGRGFFCDDQSLMRPYKEDTVSIAAAGLVGMLPLVFLILAIEAIDAFLTTGLSSKKTFFCAYGKLLTVQIGIALFGGGVCYLITEVVKLTVGRLRPHFFDICKPDFSKINCSAGFITDYVCLGTQQDLIKDAKKSFLSGHSSFVCFTMTYIIMYLQIRLPKRKFFLLRALLQAMAALGGIYVCVSRISDYKHHWSDVLAGAVLGIVTAVLTVLYVNDPQKILATRSEESEDKNVIPIVHIRKTSPPEEGVREGGLKTVVV